MKKLKRYLPLSLLLVLIGCSVLRFTKNKNPSVGHYIIECDVYNSSGEIVWSFNGGGCLFLDDGRFAVKTARGLYFYDKNYQKLWFHEIPIHHDIVWDSSKKHILVLSEEYHEYKGHKTKFDKLYAIDLDGTIAKQYSFYENLQNIKNHTPKGRNDVWRTENSFRRVKDVEFEISHSNSVYEIPRNDLEKKVPAMKSGNFIVNLNLQSMVMILNSEMNQILKIIPHEAFGGDVNAHDVQVLETGQLIAFYNRSENSRYSELISYDPWTEKTTVLYQGSPKSSFYVPFSGSIQKWENSIIFNDFTKSGKYKLLEINYSTGKILREFHPEKYKSKIYQSVRKINLSEFLSNNQQL